MWQEPPLGGYPDPGWLGVLGLERLRLGRGVNAGGKPVALATGSSIYLPGRPATPTEAEQLGSESDAGAAGA